MSNDDWFALGWSYCFIALVSMAMLLIRAWEFREEMPEWWTERHSAIITIFFPITLVLAPLYWLTIAWMAGMQIGRRLAALAFRVPR